MHQTYWERDQINEFIRVLRPLLILLICAVHIPFIAGYTANVTALDAPQMLLSVYIKDVLARSAVPLLSVISGYLAFFSYKKYGYRKFLTKKVKMVLVPFVVTNVATLIFFKLAQGISATPIPALQGIEGLASILQGVLGINRMPINGPLYFLRDLFLICCCVAIIDSIARRRLAVVCVCLALLYLNFQNSGLIVRWSEQPIAILYRVDMVFFFLLGYCFSVHGIKPKRPDSYTAFVSALFYGLTMLGVALAISILKPAMANYLEYRWSIGFLALCFLPAFMTLAHTFRETGVYRLLLRLSPYSFMMFLTHLVFAVIFTGAVSSLDIHITLTSALHWQIALFSVYLAGCIVFAIAVRKSLIAARRFLPSKAT